MVTQVAGTSHIPGLACGTTLVLDEPLSLWGGIDPSTGTIVDRQHPQCGESIAGRILVLPHGRGSSGGSAVLAECLRAGTGPAAIVMKDLDPILLVGALVAGELYPGIECPIVSSPDHYDTLVGDLSTIVHPNGVIEQAS